MTLKRFKELTDAYGSNPLRWPENERKLYDTHAKSDEGSIIIAESEKIEAIMGKFTSDVDLSPSFIKRLHAIADDAHYTKWEAGFIKFSALSIVASILIGLFIGGQVGFSSAVDVNLNNKVEELVLGPVSISGNLL